MIIPKTLDKKTGRELIAAEFDELLRSNTPLFVEKAFRDAVAALLPPPNNMGVTYPHTPKDLPHCEKSLDFGVQKTSLDWLGFSSPYEFEPVLLALQVIWPDMLATSSGAGMRGYPMCKALQVGGVQFGLIGYGAKKHGRLSVSLTGVACKTFANDEKKIRLVYDVLEVLDARLSRLDICMDFYRGEITFDYALWAFGEGQFKKPKANEQPKQRVIGEKGGRGENLGRTMYIGMRDGELYGRVYEKGLEVFAKMSDEYREACTERELSGEAVPETIGTIADDWVRLEAEFKRKSKDRPLPLLMVLDRDAYFAGAYPFFATSLGKGEGKGRGSLKSTNEITHDKLINAHRRAFGNHVHTLVEIGLTDTEIVALLNTGMHNQRLLKAGLVSVEQAAIRSFRQDEGGQDFDIPF